MCIPAADPLFDPYQVAAWADGAQFVLIPYAELADLLDPAGPLGKTTLKHEARKGSTKRH